MAKVITRLKTRYVASSQLKGLPVLRGHCTELGLIKNKINKKSVNFNGPKKLKFRHNIYWQLSSEFIPSWKRQHKEGRQNSLEDTENIQVFIFSYQSFSITFSNSVMEHFSSQN